MSALLLDVYCSWSLLFIKKKGEKIVDRLLKRPAGQWSLVKHLQNYLQYVKIKTLRFFGEFFWLFVFFPKGNFRFSMAVRVSLTVGRGYKAKQNELQSRRKNNSDIGLFYVSTYEECLIRAVWVTGNSAQGGFTHSFTQPLKQLKFPSDPLKDDDNTLIASFNTPAPGVFLPPLSVEMRSSNDQFVQRQRKDLGCLSTTVVLRLPPSPAHLSPCSPLLSTARLSDFDISSM